MIKGGNPLGDLVPGSNHDGLDTVDAIYSSNPQSIQHWLNVNDENIESLEIPNTLSLPINNMAAQSISVDQSMECLQDIYLPSSECLLDYSLINISSFEQNIDEQFSNLTSPHYDYEETSPLSIWGSSGGLNDFKIEEVFQVDKEDLFQGPTLAELNANDESLFDSLNAFDFCSSEISTGPLIFPPEAKISKLHSNTAMKNEIKEDIMSRKKSTSENVFEFNLPQPVPPLLEKERKPKEISIKIEEEKSAKVIDTKNMLSIPGCSKFSSQENVEIKNIVSESHSEKIDESLKRKNPCRTTKLNSEKYNFHEEDTDDESQSSSIDSEDEEDEADDVDIISMPKKNRRNKNTGSQKRPGYFWQYNMQAKGPKCAKSRKLEDKAYKRSSSLHDIKSRRGDSDDLTPCPEKLHHIGIELDKLNSVINNMIPVNSLPVNARPKCRKEKNKLASRVCRLKKKAQYEANKVKLYGLQKEHASLLNVVQKVKEIVIQRVSNTESKEFYCERAIGDLCSLETVPSVADSQAEFVNKVLKNVESGDPSGGLEEWHDIYIPSKTRGR